MKKKSVRKKIFYSTFFIFILFNAIWLLNYMSYSEVVLGYEKLPKVYKSNIDDYTLTVKKPGYPFFTGNYAIANEDLSYIIWPGFLMKGEYEHGLTIYDTDIEHGYIFYVDRNFIYQDIPENNFSDLEVKIIDSLLDKNAEELDIMRNIAIKEWNLKKEKSE